jgi:hypothetical protein|tara:strand:+ start:8072 stop:8518 length:447 start_codon:yes stop_codon:yes gene_type:complete
MNLREKLKTLRTSLEFDRDKVNFKLLTLNAQIKLLEELTGKTTPTSRKEASFLPQAGKGEVCKAVVGAMETMPDYVSSKEVERKLPAHVKHNSVAPALYNMTLDGTVIKSELDPKDRTTDRKHVRFLYRLANRAPSTQQQVERNLRRA